MADKGFSQYDSLFPLFENNENAKMRRWDEYARLHREQTFPLSSLPETEIEGIPVCSVRNPSGELEVTFARNAHALIIGATRSGKTTGFALPAINIMLRYKNKASFVISDPKKEIYTKTAKIFADNGYDIKLIDFQDYRTSDCWNPLSHIFYMYEKYMNIINEVTCVTTENGYRNSFRGKIYESQEELDLDIDEIRMSILADIDNAINSISSAVSPVQKKDDPYWDNMACMMIRAFIYAMLEDSNPETKCAKFPIITADTFTFDTIIRISHSFVNENSSIDDNGYFTDRNPERSKAYQLVVNSVIQLVANTTRSCILSCFFEKISKFVDTSVRRITCTNTMRLDSLDGDRPTVIFISYKDEDAVHYDLIGLFLTDLYTNLIASARKKHGVLGRPFYFMLDEFGNFPRFKDFDKVISACGSRNIWFLLIVQSYAQLYNVYGKEISDIIIDNLNLHIFFASNNPQTKRDFSEECGKKTIISPLSALNGSGERIDSYVKETVPLIPVSMLSGIPEGECIITQMSDDVIWSRIERSYNCPEFDTGTVYTEDRVPQIKFSSPQYVYKFKVT